MKYENHARELSGSRPAWFNSVQSPRTLSPLWVLECAASLSVPLAGLALAAVASGIVPVTFQ